MLGKLYIKVAAVRGAGAQAFRGASPTSQDPMQGSYEHQLHPWGTGPMGRFGRFDSSRPEWAAAQAEAAGKPGATRTEIPSWATHRDMYGNFYEKDDQGQYDRIAPDPSTGQLMRYPVNTEMQANGTPGIRTRGRGTTRESMGSALVSPEEALGLTDVASARASGATHVDQSGQFFRGGTADMVSMDQVNPEMAKNYRANGLTPPQVDRSQQTTAERWAANPANAQAVAAKAQRDARFKNPAYQAQVNAMYAKQGIPAAQRPAWLNTPAAPAADTQVQAAVSPAPAATPATTAATTPGIGGNPNALVGGGTPATTAATTPGIGGNPNALVGGKTPAPAPAAPATAALPKPSTSVTTGAVAQAKPSAQPKVIGITA